MARASSGNRCWPGYEPVPGKRAHEEGSCRPKAKSKLTPKEKAVRRRRAQQLARTKLPAKQRSARRHSLAPPKGVAKSRRTSRRPQTRRAAH